MISDRPSNSDKTVLGRALLFIVLVPLIELVLLSQLLQHTGLLTTLAVVFITGIIGISLTRRQGMKAWLGAHKQMAAGRSPSTEILDGVMILLAGAFLITPGLLTDTVGFSLLVPQVRRFLGKRLTRWFKSRTVSTFRFQTGGPEMMPADDQPADEGPSVRVVNPEEFEQQAEETA